SPVGSGRNNYGRQRISIRIADSNGNSANGILCEDYRTGAGQGSIVDGGDIKVYDRLAALRASVGGFECEAVDAMKVQIRSVDQIRSGAAQAAMGWPN